MPIEITCQHCNKRLRVKDSVAGKRIKCPQCQEIFLVPKQGGNWFVQTPDKEEYGPIPRSEVDEWFAEGRITSDTQLLEEGAEQWQWASDIFPTLSTPDSAGSSSGPFDFGAADSGSAPKTDDPFNFGEKASTPAASSDSGVPAFGGPAGSSQTGAISTTASTSAAGSTGQSPRDQLAAALLGIFGGSLGIHNFYMGKKNKAIIQIVVTMCTCGIGAWWGIIEGFMLLGGKTVKDAKGRPMRRDRF